MPCNIVAYPVILIPEAINPERTISYTRQNRVPTFILDAINPGRGISYAMQNRAPTYQYPVIQNWRHWEEELEENPKCGHAGTG